MRFPYGTLDWVRCVSIVVMLCVMWYAWTQARKPIGPPTKSPHTQPMETINESSYVI